MINLLAAEVQRTYNKWFIADFYNLPEKDELLEKHMEAQRAVQKCLLERAVQCAKRK